MKTALVFLLLAAAVVYCWWTGFVPWIALAVCGAMPLSILLTLCFPRTTGSPRSPDP